MLIVEIVTSLDREVIENYTIVITATDGGGCSSYINLTITLSDVNELPPLFNDTDGYETHIKEGDYRQHIVYTVSCL